MKVKLLFIVDKDIGISYKAIAYGELQLRLTIAPTADFRAAILE